MRLSVDSFLGRDEATWADFGVLAQPLAWALVCSSPTELGRWFDSCQGSPRNETQQREVDWKRGVGVPLASSLPQTSWPRSAQDGRNTEPLSRRSSLLGCDLS